MTIKKRRILLLTLSALVLIAISLAAGFVYGFRQGLRAGGLTSSMAEFVKAQEYMLAQFSNGNCDGVKAALKDHLALLDKYRNVEGSFISGDFVSGKMYYPN